MATRTHTISQYFLVTLAYGETSHLTGSDETAFDVWWNRNRFDESKGTFDLGDYEPYVGRCEITGVRDADVVEITYTERVS